MSKLSSANKRVKDAKKALKAAQKAAQKAKVEAAAIKAEEALQAADRAVWEVCNAADWPDNLRAVYKRFDPLRDAFADAVFGARERLLKLNKLDADRWALEGEFAPCSHYFTTDEDMAYAIATWLFDCCVEKNPKDERYQALLSRAQETVGAEVADQGFSFYLEGRHDT